MNEHLAAPLAQVNNYRQVAAARLDAAIWRYLEEGASAAALHDNLQAFAARRLLPRPLGDVRGGHTRLTLFGQEFEHPLLLAPIAYQRLFHEAGECASAMAASAQGGTLLISSLASQPLEAIAQAGRLENGGAPWFQLYWQGDRARTLRLLQRAEAAGCTVMVFTIDAPIKLATLQLPGDVQAVNLEAPAAPSQLSNAGSRVFDGWMAQAPTWDDLAWLRQQTTRPLLLKGILHADDARRAMTMGCDGLVVSNHGGRVLDGASASIDALPGIVAGVDGRIPVLLDSGIRSGRDAFLAMALGASAVLIGRPYIWGLAANGAMGVAHVIRLLRDELEMTMALTGCASLAAIGPQCLSAG